MRIRVWRQGKRIRSLCRIHWIIWCCWRNVRFIVEMLQNQTSRLVFCSIVQSFYSGLITAFSPKLPTIVLGPLMGFTPSSPCTIANRVMILGSGN